MMEKQKIWQRNARSNAIIAHETITMSHDLAPFSSHCLERAVFIFISIHLLMWTFAAAYFRLNLPIDSIEGAIWGHQLAFGYEKNPFLNAWLTALALYLDHHTGWLLYFFSQLSAAICFVVIWKLAKAILPLSYAFIAVLSLEGSQYFNFHALDFNDNTLELGLWALTIYFFYQALKLEDPYSSFQSKPKKSAAWIWTGIFAGLAVVAKYYSLGLLAAMTLFLMSDQNNRAYLKTWPPYVALSIFLLIVLPHVIWLFFHDFVTIRYMLKRISARPHWMNHFYFFTQFTWQQLQVIFPTVLLLSINFLGKPFFARDKLSISRFDKRFLLYIGLGPFLLTIFLSLLLGIKLRAGWGMPLLSLWSIFFVILFRLKLTKRKLQRFTGVIYLLLILLIVGYVYSLVNSKDESSANFPGKKIAHALTKNWHDRYHTQLAYIAGSRWIAGNVSFYSKDHPATFILWNTQFSPWIVLQKMRSKGAIFVWNISSKETLPEAVKLRYPELSKPEKKTFFWERNRNHLLPIEIGFAFLPPQKFVN